MEASSRRQRDAAQDRFPRAAIGAPVARFAARHTGLTVRPISILKSPIQVFRRAESSTTKTPQHGKWHLNVLPHDH